MCEVAIGGVHPCNGSISVKLALGIDISDVHIGNTIVDNGFAPPINIEVKPVVEAGDVGRWVATPKAD